MTVAVIWVRQDISDILSESNVIGARRRQVYDRTERLQGLIGVGAALDSDC